MKDQCETILALPNMEFMKVIDVGLANGEYTRNRGATAILEKELCRRTYEIDQLINS